MSIKSKLVQLLDRFYREPKLIKQYYHNPTDIKAVENTNVFMVDGKIPHGGMFDRLKGIMTIFAISKVRNIPFRICWSYPFNLEKYLEPNSYNWVIPENKMIYHYPLSRPVRAYGEIEDPSRLWKQPKGQIHFYYGYNQLEKINDQFDKKYNWGELYRELFKPTAYLQQYLDSYKEEIGEDYIAIHTRFLNLLGDKNETDINPELSDIDKKKLIDKIISEIQKIQQIHHYRILLATDSMNFIKHAKERLDNIYIVPGKVKHIDTAESTDDSENLKLFVDYYLISGSKKVYSIYSVGMWRSAFPEYAALIGGVPFKRIEL